jgi:hypothetical protein
VTVRDAVMFRGGERASDLALVNTEEKNDVFGIVEVHRGENAPQWMPTGSGVATQRAGGGG